jgi:ligand-binding SRPBCC domain-containing protein
MAFYSITTKQKVPITLEEAWEFFSSPKNLATITPDHLGFKITSTDVREKMYPGQIITYTVKPVLGIPLPWMTEITHVADKEYFVDEQRFGPYALWHHKHFFRKIEGGVECIDKVDYKLPLGFLGSIAHSLFVKKQLKGIFNYRHKKLEELFGVWKD